MPLNVSKFDTNSITPGTQFMARLAEYIKDDIRRDPVVNRDGRTIKVLFSGSNTPGEGEAKIMSWLRAHSQAGETNAIFGLDADLIILSLNTGFSDIFLLRERVYFGGSNPNTILNKEFEEIEFDFLSIDELRTAFCRDVREKTDREYDPSHLVLDYVFLSYLLGNDFLPHLPGLSVKGGGVDDLLRHYLIALRPARRHLVLQDGTVNTGFLRAIIYSLANDEGRLIHEEHMRHQRIRFEGPPSTSVSAEEDHANRVRAFEIVLNKEKGRRAVGAAWMERKILRSLLRRQAV